MSDAIAVPTGTVTFLFTDIEGSTRLWQDEPEAMRAALAEHDALLREVIEKRRGFVFKHTGDGVAAAFASAGDAVDAAVDAQARLAGLPFRVRMGLHTGEAQVRDGDYFGPTVNRCARLMAVAHGGQIVVVGGDGRARPRSRRSRRPRRAPAPGPGRSPSGSARSGPSAFPPLRSLRRCPATCPRSSPASSAATDEVAEVAEASAPHRIVTLTGPGGVGKTRLAIQVGAELSAAYQHGVWLIELAPVLDPEALPYALASTLGVQPRPMMSVARERAAVPGRAAGPADPRQLRARPRRRRPGRRGAAAACPGVTVLATSREALAVDGEQVWPLAVARRRHRRRGAVRRPGARRPPGLRRRDGDDVAPSPRSAVASTASRSPSSSRPPAPSRCRRATSPRVSTSGSGS